MKTIPFNINDNIQVKLTDYGKEMLRRDHESFNQQYPPGFPYSEPTEDNLGYSTWQMWDLMSKLGKYVGMCEPNPFETGIKIEIVND